MEMKKYFLILTLVSNLSFSAERDIFKQIKNKDSGNIELTKNTEIQQDEVFEVQGVYINKDKKIAIINSEQYKENSKISENYILIKINKDNIIVFNKKTKEKTKIDF